MTCADKYCSMNTTALTPETNTPSAPPLQKETTAGNYFVSNYPPFSFWKPERVGELHTALERPPTPGTPLGVYLHIPFCRKRCHFCYFKVYTDKDSAAIRGYIEAAIKELSIYAAKPFIDGRKPNFVYFGGTMNRRSWYFTSVSMIASKEVVPMSHVFLRSTPYP